MKFAAALTAVLIAAAMPAAAQMPPPPPGDMPGGPMHPPGNPMFAGLSEAGKAIMHNAMKGADPRADRAATDAARDRMLVLLDADRLDVPALKRAMDEEREASNAAKVRHQAAMLAGLQQLSLADRKAFVANARAMRAQMAERMGQWKGRRGPHGPGPGGPGAMPPPPQ